MDLGLTDKSVIVTGAGTGIGEAVAKRFAAEGTRVLCCGLPEDPIEAVAGEIRDAGGSADAFGGDLSDPATAERACAAAKEKHGPLYCLVNVAGVYQVMGEHAAISPQDMEYMYRHSVHNALLMTKYALPQLQLTRGNVLFTGSETATLGQPNAAIYGGAKGYLLAFARGLAMEQAKHGVRANIVCPGPTMTQWHDTSVSSMDKQTESQIVGSVPMGRHANPEEIANVYAFLASERATFVTASVYFADGGISVSRGTPGEEVPEEIKQHHKQFLQLDLKHQMQGMNAQPQGMQPHRA